MNELHIILPIVIIFVLVGTLTPYVHSAFDSSTTDINLDGFQDDLLGEVEDNVNAGDVALSVLRMLFWDFGDFPFWLDAIFWIMRVMLILAIVKLLPFT